MEESERRVADANREGTPAERVVAARVLETAHSYRQWELGHSHLMRTVADRRQLDRQAVALRSTAFSLLHRKALFEYIRDRRVMGSKRQRLLGLFSGPREYIGALLKEHINYVHSTSSYLCTEHLGAVLIGDPVFEEPIQLYQERYTEYFRIYCDVALAQTEDEQAGLAPLAALQPMLKAQLTQARRAILAMGHEEARTWREVQIRKPTGDTQKLKALFAGALADEVRKHTS
ncbi:MAG TPA: hypothetical protein VGM84_24270 [Steroidobacteraceae bacterium]